MFRLFINRIKYLSGGVGRAVREAKAERCNDSIAARGVRPEVMACSCSDEIIINKFQRNNKMCTDAIIKSRGVSEGESSACRAEFMQEFGCEPRSHSTRRFVVRYEGRTVAKIGVLLHREGAYFAK